MCGGGGGDGASEQRAPRAPNAGRPESASWSVPAETVNLCPASARPPARTPARLSTDRAVVPPAGRPAPQRLVHTWGQRATSKTVGTEFKLKSHSRLKTLAAAEGDGGGGDAVRGLCHLLAWRQRRRRQSPDGEREGG